MRVSRSALAALAAFLSLASGCFWAKPAITWVEAGPRKVDVEELSSRSVTSPPTYQFKRVISSDVENVLTIPVTRSVLTRTETTFWDHTIATEAEQRYRKLNWYGENLRGVSAGVASLLIGLGISQTLNEDSDGRDDVRIGVPGIAVGVILLGSSTTKGFDLEAKRSQTGKTRQVERSVDTRIEYTSPKEVTLPAVDRAFKVTTQPPLFLKSGGDVTADISGTMRLTYGFARGWYRTEPEARKAIASLPEARDLTDRARSSKVYRDFIEHRGVVSRSCAITFKPGEQVDRERQRPLGMDVKAYAPSRGVNYAVAAALCDSEINAKTRGIALSVRDAVTRQPVIAKVELDVTAPAPEEVLGAYLSGELLRQALTRAVPYVRGKKAIAATGDVTFVTLLVPSSVSYRVSADGYREAKGALDRLEHGPVLIELERARSR